MRNVILSTYSSKESEKFLYPPKRWDESEDKALTMDELIRSNRELEQFAFVASHDLQEPLKIISLYLQILNRKYEGSLDNKAVENISSILEKAERMQKLIQSILSYAQVGKGNVQFTPLDSNVAINQAIENLKVTIEENSVQISCEDCPAVMGDEIRLTQLFQNLINNAIKFRKKEEFSRIHISVKQKDDQWLFSIEDNGIGIEREHIQDIFEIFKRLHSQSEYAGSGIGLALCKRIVESHGGNIWAKSDIGKGTTVYFTIPKL
jgi:light-regulated signal transduction histidine kinase (bacteriophytochrome)